MNDRAVRKHDFECQHIFPHRAVTPLRWCRKRGRCHAAKGWHSHRDRWERISVRARADVRSALPRDASLHRDIEVTLVHGDHLIHPSEIDADPTLQAREHDPRATCLRRKLITGAALRVTDANNMLPPPASSVEKPRHLRASRRDELCRVRAPRTLPVRMWTACRRAGSELLQGLLPIGG